MNWIAIFVVYAITSACSIALGSWWRGRMEAKAVAARPAHPLINVEIRMAGTIVKTNMLIDTPQLEQLANGIGKHLVDMPSIAKH